MRPSSIKILYIDRDPECGAAFQAAAGNHGYETVTVVTGRDALEQCRSAAFDIAVVDPSLPDTDGLAVVRDLAALAPDMALFVISDSNDRGAVSDFMSLGISNYFVKDVDGIYLELLPHAFERVLERKTLQQGQKREAARLRDFADSSADWFWEMDEELKFTFISDRFYEITGMQPADRVGAKRTGTVDPELYEADKDNWDTHFADMKAGRPFKNFQYQLKTPKGELITIRSSGVPIFDAGNHFRGYRGTGTDITAHLRAETALRRNEQAFKDMIETLPDAAIVICGDKVVHVNSGACKLFGAPSRDAMVGMDAMTFIHPEFKAAAIGRRDKTIRDGVIHHVEGTQHRRLDGTFFDSEVSVGPAVWQGRPGTINLIRNVTDRIAADRAAKETSATLNALMEYTPCSILLRNMEGRYLLVNKQFAENRGLTVSDLIGKHYTEIASTAESARLDAHTKQIIETGEPIEYEFEGENAFVGQVFQSISFPVRDEAGALLGIGGFYFNITERTKAERIARETSAMLNALLEYAPFAITLRDLDCRYLMANKQFAENLGLSLDSIIGEPIENIAREGQAGRARENTEEIIRTGQQVTFTFEGQDRLRGQYFNVTSFPVRDEAGHLFSIGTVLVNDTEQVLAERNLQEREALLRGIVGHSPSLIHLKDLEGKFRLANGRIQEWYGLDMYEAIGKTSHDLFPEFAANQFVAQDKAILSSGVVDTREVETMFADKFMHTILNTKFPVFDANGDITGIATIATDITDLKRRETEISEKTALLQTILDTVPAIVTVRDNDDRIIFSNKFAAEFYGKPVDELYGKTAEELLGQPVEGPFHWVKRTGKPYSNPNFESIRHPGMTLWILGAPIIGDNQEDLGVVIVSLDVSEQRRSEKKLELALMEAERANRAKTEFLATMSHELRTPLNAIIGFSEVITGQYFGPLGSPRYVEYAGDIAASGAHLLELINDLLDLSAIESGEHKLWKTALDIGEVVADCEPTIMQSAKRNNINFSKDIAADLPALFADRRSVKQILLNLLINATKFTPAGGKVALRISQADGALKFEVQDNGAGIPAENMENLTKPFVRGQVSSLISHEGAGLGLAIVKSLVDMHDGTLAFDSLVGAGTTVTVTLPLEPYSQPHELGKISAQG